MKKSKIKKVIDYTFQSNKFIYVLFFILVFLFKLPILNTPHHWDAFEEILEAKYLKLNNLNPLSLSNFGMFEGHPLFLFEILAIAFIIFGEALWEIGRAHV
jgi:hypothetical protein